MPAVALTKYNLIYHQRAAPIKQNRSIRICASILGIGCIAAGASKAMMTTAASSSSSNGGAYTTIKERVRFEKEIKKSKFIAIAGPIPDEQSAQSFLSQVLSLFFFFNFFKKENNLKIKNRCK